jgi:hypothetical protein
VQGIVELAIASAVEPMALPRALEAGRFVIGGSVTDALDKSSTQRLLEKHGGRFINYYGSWAVEELKR